MSAILDLPEDELNGVEHCIKMILHITEHGEVIQNEEFDRGLLKVWRLGNYGVMRDLDGVSLLLYMGTEREERIELHLKQTRVWQLAMDAYETVMGA